MVKINNVKDLEMMLIELNDSAKNLVTNGIEATELHILLRELDRKLIKGKEVIVKDKCLYDEALENIKNLEEIKEHNDELQKSYIMVSLTTPVEKIHKEIVSVNKKIKYELEFEENKIGSYNIYFGDNNLYIGNNNFVNTNNNNFAHINIFKPNRIYQNTRLVKNLIEDEESYIETFNFDNDYIIIRNDKLNRFVIFTRTDKNTDTFNYLAPEEYCNDKNRI